MEAERKRAGRNGRKRKPAALRKACSRTACSCRHVHEVQGESGLRYHQGSCRPGQDILSEPGKGSCRRKGLVPQESASRGLRQQDSASSRTAGRNARLAGSGKLVPPRSRKAVAWQECTKAGRLAGPDESVLYWSGWATKLARDESSGKRLRHHAWFSFVRLVQFGAAGPPRVQGHQASPLKHTKPVPRCRLRPTPETHSTGRSTGLRSLALRALSRPHRSREASKPPTSKPPKKFLKKVIHFSLFARFLFARMAC